MSEDERVTGILLTHGAMAAGMSDAIQKIAGAEPDALIPLSNEGSSPEELAGRLEALIGDRPAVIFTDLRTGSCALAARVTCEGRGGRAVVFGANLPMLLDFVFHRTLTLDELLPRLIEKGRDGVHAVREGPSHGDPAVPN